MCMCVYFTVAVFPKNLFHGKSMFIICTKLNSRYKVIIEDVLTIITYCNNVHCLNTNLC